MKPSVGRIVHYGKKFVDTGEIEPLAALITHVLITDPLRMPDEPLHESNWRVSVRTFGPAGDDGVHFDAPYSEALADKHWSWPPRV